jgi:type III secretory pathway component EscR
MWDTIAFLGLIACIVFIVLAVIALIKRNGTAKKKWMYVGISFVVFMVGIINAPTTTETANTTEEETATNTETNEVNTTETTVNEKTDEELAKEQEAAEKQRQEEEAKKQALEEQQKYADMADFYIPALTDNNLELSDVTFEYFKTNNKLFPAITLADIDQAKKITDSSIASKHLNKNAGPYLDKMVTFSGTIVSIEENTENDETTTVIHIIDNDMQSYQILLFKPAGDVFEDDVVRFWGVPVGPSSFDNVSGGTTNVQFLVGSHVEKN